ncbi:MAG TPA: glycosyltransferase family 4 protein [Haliscomenobacter sp.]|uniref:glycosyltransferase family 4 protein n=1 Tax=Haliscomenobacter sp. TaxID=2717303 RepID=UPI002C1CA41C|nr:glycosyltransferase family 4 protein [Haliscomenobacter sp.]HOY16304.1 glycosyltransferase family 4 protein [Haliscomenobacter sp.]HPH18500.1 glycosyltransferase family 4 protein [Haliscomenobacter sp.]
MRILQLCKKFPFPLKEGEAIAVYFLSRGLVEQGCTVDLLAMNTSKHFYAPSDWPAEFSHYTEINAVKVDNKLSTIGAFQNLFSRESYHVSRFDTPEFAAALSEALARNNYDAILLETLYLAPYIPMIRSKSKAAVVMRSHNVEFAIWERIIANTAPGLKRQYLRHLTHKLRRFEIAQLKKYDLLATVSAHDLAEFKRLGYQGYHLVAPIGLDLDRYPVPESDVLQPLSLGFIGSLDWMPNQEALEWFIQKVWPLLRRHFPELVFEIAGRNAPAHFLKNKVPGIKFTGEVPDAAAFMAAHPISLAPMRSGSGIKVKVLEAMALERVVLGTTIALEGIPAQDGKEFFLANTPEEYVQQLLGLRENPHLARKLGKAARALVKREFDYRDVAKKLLAGIERTCCDGSA